MLTEQKIKQFDDDGTPNRDSNNLTVRPLIRSKALGCDDLGE